MLRYIRGTIQFGIHYSIRGEPLLVGFTDSDWANDPDDRKSTTGYVFSLDLDLSLGLVRNNKLFLFLHQKENIEPQLIPVRKIL